MNSNNSIKFLILTCLSVFAFPYALYAQGASQILSVTPPLFQLSVEPGSVWQSSVKVVNGNPYELTVYAEIVNFAPMGEEGQGKFIPILHNGEVQGTLAEWIEMPVGPYVVPPEQTMDLPFFVDVPKDASPGGHFAAILIGTQPPKTSTSSLDVLTSQAITSLFFVRIEGDIDERADIREFSVVDSFTEEPSAEFSLRFENKGNVHVQPRGNIIITNMWGTERGIIPINHQTHFGNVLPQSIRDFRFTWKGEKSLTDIGRYTAIATIGYGEDGVKSATATAYFWVIPVKAALITITILATFILLVTWMIKLYVRKMLALAGVDVESKEYVGTAKTLVDERDVRMASYKHVSAPIRSGARDLKERLSGVTEFIDVLKTIFEFILYYKKFFISVLILIIAFIGAVLYMSDVSKTERDFEVTIQEGDGARTLTDDEIKSENIDVAPQTP